jgi:hypothetical protein
MMTLALITLLAGPWKGPSLPTVTPGSQKYKLTLRGPASADVDLRAQGLPKGWIASFCTERSCSPFHYTLELNDRGHGEIEFAAIRTDAAAPVHVHVTITADGKTHKELDVTAH